MKHVSSTITPIWNAASVSLETETTTCSIKPETIDSFSPTKTQCPGISIEDIVANAKRNQTPNAAHPASLRHRGNN